MKRKPAPGAGRARPRGGGWHSQGRSADPRGAAGVVGPSTSRRALSHVGGRVERLRGPEALRAAIRRALSVDPEAGVRDHVHGFHGYPARLHPVTAARLIEDLCPPAGRVGDCFCGSGTVPVEALRLGREVVASDLNPLAVCLSRFKTHPLDAAGRAALSEAAARVSEFAEDRRLRSAGPVRRHPQTERDLYDPHVLLELDGLAEGIRKEPEALREPLQLALSSMLSKVARSPRPNPQASRGKKLARRAPADRDGGPGKKKRADQEEPEFVAKRIAAGFTNAFFVARVSELCRQLAEYQALLPTPRPRSRFLEGDARELPKLGYRGIDLFVSSPPYPGVLDYADYHRSRLTWMGLSGKRFAEREIGARRSLQRLDHEEAVRSFEHDFSRTLSAMAQSLSPHGRIAMIVADSLLAGRPYFADEMLERCAAHAGLRVAAQGSQRRPHFHRQSAKAFGRRPRHEHLVVLERLPPRDPH